MQQNSLQVQIKFEFTKWFEWKKLTAKFYIWKQFYSIEWFFIGKWQPIFVHMKIPSFRDVKN